MSAKNNYRNWSSISLSHEYFVNQLFADKIIYGQAGDFPSKRRGTCGLMHTDHRNGVNLKGRNTRLTIPMISVGKSGVFNNHLKFRGGLMLDKDGMTECTATAMCVPPLSSEKFKDTWKFAIKPVPGRNGEMVVKYTSKWLTQKFGHLEPSFRWRKLGCILILSVIDAERKVHCLTLAVCRPKRKQSHSKNAKRKMSGASASSAPAKRTSPPPPPSSASTEGNASKRNRRQTKLNEVTKAALTFSKKKAAVLPLTNNLRDHLAMSKDPEQSRLIAQHTLKQLTESYGWDFLSQTWDMYRYNRPPALSRLPAAAPAASHASSAMDPTHASSAMDHASSAMDHASSAMDHASSAMDHASSVMDPSDDYSPELLNELIDGIGISGEGAGSAGSAAADRQCVTPPTPARAATAASDNAAPTDTTPTDTTPTDTTPVAAAAATTGLCLSPPLQRPHRSPSPQRMLDPPDHAAVDTPVAHDPTRSVPMTLVAHDPTHSVPMIPENQMPSDLMFRSRREEEWGLGHISTRTNSYNI